MIKLKWISIENFKCFADTRIDFGTITEAFGQNAVGKTSVFDAFCFALFGTNSKGDAKFDYKPFDRDGNPIHNLVTSVECGLEVDGKDTVLKRTMKENWVKKRGSEQAVFQGNVGSYEVDGYPRSEKEFKEIVNGIIDADIFKILTNPIHFASMPWKQQREILMSMLNGESDAELAKTIGGYDNLVPELEKAPSADAIREKYSKTLKELKATQKELPVRIDEVHKQITEVDVKALDAEKQKLEADIAAKEAEVLEAHKAEGEERELRNKLSQIESEMRHEVALANASNATKRAELTTELSNARSRMQEIMSSAIREKSSLSRKQEQYKQAVEAVEHLKVQYKTEKTRMFAANMSELFVSDRCPSCGQMLPKERIESARLAEKKRFEEQSKAFEAIKKTKLEMLAENGKAQAEIRDTVAAEIEQIKSDIADKELLEESISKRIAELEKEIDNLPADVTTSDSDKYKALAAELDKTAKQAKEAYEKSKNAYELEGELRGLRNALQDMQRIYLAVEHNNDLRVRIEQLTAEQQDVSQKIMDCEKMLYLLESFTKDKMERISSEINSHFDGVNFRLFELQINGGLKETCECTVDGVPYASLNSGHRIVAGLNIIKALQTVYGQTAPIFLDNAESINEYNIPDMGDTQMILLKVTDDKALKVEVKV